ncbi:hypothetical protein [Mesorhizobium sp. SP-1A]|uniref:hypothetical protein n=1 Tax=Mesorhizobium sp. SP-1A TaxID=3077840 RepID=UPI0028F7104F|nr:hypothetical protein [Mesorhizobium sp. SP-1A]
MHPLQFVNSNLDAELMFIVTEGVRNFVETSSKDSKGATRGQCSDLTAKLVFETICERHPECADKFSEYEIQKVANDIFQAIETKDIGYLALYPQIAERLLHYMSVRLMGVRAAYVDPRAETHHDSYWPFGQEGGFCNPMKLKMLAEDGY